MKLTKEECIDLINRAESNPMKRIDTNPRRKYYVQSWDEYSGTLFDKINEYFFSNLNLNLNRVRVNVLKYQEGDLFERHNDRNTELEFNRKFVFNINCILNMDFTGGEFYLEDKPYLKQIGELYHYNSTKYHEVKPITSGTRYSALFAVFEDDINNSDKKLL